MTSHEITVAEFIKWLKTKDQGTIVEIVSGERGRDYHGDNYGFENFSPEKTEYIDFRGNTLVGPSEPYHNKRFLQIGELA